MQAQKYFQKGEKVLCYQHSLDLKLNSPFKGENMLQVDSIYKIPAFKFVMCYTQLTGIKVMFPNLTLNRGWGNLAAQSPVRFNFH